MSEVVSRRGVIANAEPFFVLTLDIPLNVVFDAPAPLCTSTPAADSVAPITSPPSRSATPSSATVAKRVVDRAVTRPKRRAPRCDVMSRDRTPETVWRATGRHGQGRCELSGSVGRVDAMSRPRSRSVCAGKYCSVSRPQPLASSSKIRRTAGGVPLRPQSATTVRHPPHTPTRHHLSTAPTGRVHVARQPVHAGITVDDDDVDSGVTSSVITSCDTSPRSSGSRDRAADRQGQLRRFLDAASTSSSSSQHDQHPSDVTDDDDDVPGSETRRASVCQDDECHLYSSVKSDDQPASAMDQVRHLVARCRLPVCTSTERHVNAARRQDARTRTINHHSTYPSSVTSEAIQQAIIGAAADLVTDSDCVLLPW